MRDDADESDEVIATLAKDGDRRAFDTLINRHKDGLYRFVRRYVGVPDDAYDVVQSCFLAAWLALARYDPKRPFLPWLRTIALNKCRDHGRRASARRLLLQGFASERAALESEALAEDTVQERRLERLDAAISSLSAYYKEPLLLTTVAGLSHKEAADLLETTPKAIEMRLYRARRKLADFMGEG